MARSGVSCNAGDPDCAGGADQSNKEVKGKARERGFSGFSP